MNAERRLRLWNLAVERAAGEPVAVEHVCSTVVSAARVDGVGVTVVLGTVPRVTVYTSDAVASELEELTLTVGEGPGVDALVGGPVLVADLKAPEHLVRWPAFTPGAIDAGAGAVFALPLQAGGVRVGVMDLYRAHPGELSLEHLADALVLADTTCALLLDAPHSAVPHPNGHRPEEVRPQHPEVHQATGMIIAQLGVTAAVALIRLRAHAYASNRLLRDVAGDVVARRLRFTPEPGADLDGGEDSSGG